MQGIAAIRVEKYKNFLGENTPRPPPPTLNAIPHQTFCYQQTIYHFSTLGIVSLLVDGPPTDEFLKNALVSSLFEINETQVKVTIVYPGSRNVGIPTLHDGNPQLA
jgi:hypothetical protein